ncbi:LysE family transporter [Cupriavidus basilensis]
MNAFMHTAFGITDFWTYVLGTIFIVLLPGAELDVRAVRGGAAGVRTGYKGACGVFLGDAVLMVLSAAGVASLLKASPALFYVVKYIGAAYLGWIGFNMLRGAVRNWTGAGKADRAAADAAVAAPAEPVRSVLQGTGHQPDEPQGHPVLHLVLHPVRRSGFRLCGAVVPGAGRGRADLQLPLPDDADLRRREAGRRVPPPPPPVGGRVERRGSHVHRLRREAGDGHPELNFPNPAGIPDFPAGGPDGRRIKKR